MLDFVEIRKADSILSLKNGVNIQTLSMLRNLILKSHRFAKTYRLFGKKTRNSKYLKLTSSGRNLVTDQIAGIIPGDGSNIKSSHQIVVQKNTTRKYGTIAGDHALYDPLLYVMLFPSGNKGYSRGMTDSKGKKITMLQYYR